MKVWQAAYALIVQKLFCMGIKYLKYPKKNKAYIMIDFSKLRVDIRIFFYDTKCLVSTTESSGFVEYANPRFLDLVSGFIPPFPSRKS